GDDFGGDNADVAQIAAAATVRQAVGSLTVSSSGLMDLNGKNLIVNGTTTLFIGQTTSGDVQTGAGTLTQNGNISLALAAAASNAAAATAAPPATITGNLNLNNGNRTVTLINHATANTFTNSAIGIIGSDDLRI